MGMGWKGGEGGEGVDGGFFLFVQSVLPRRYKTDFR